ncbi:hypothetical protein QUB68_05845 [Microcoleus sp. A006_D1]|uniref:hypothetical protein n=1 Tax=Microcoleus sp. A006_D1 TaxID=3055267 RepID=UPI002FD434C5
MPDASPCRKKKKLTLVASKQGVEIAERALIRLGFDSKSNFAVAQRLSRSTVTNFFKQVPIQLDSFKTICDALKLKWQEIAGITGESINYDQIERQVNPSPDIEEGVKLKMLSRTVTVVDEPTQTSKAVITLKGDIDSISNLQILAFILKEYGGHTIQITDIKEGSIKLIIEGSQEDIERLLIQIQSGELTELDGFPVEDAQILSESSEEQQHGLEQEATRTTGFVLIQAEQRLPKEIKPKSKEYKRVREIETSLKMLRAQLHYLEKEIILTTSSPAQFQLKRRLETDIQPRIQKYEQEYWQILAKTAETVEIPAPEAEIIVAEIVEEVGQIEVQQLYPDEVLHILREIRDKLDQPGPTAAAKLKGVISSIPPFVGISYEAELDTENIFQRHFPTFQKWAKALAKKS